MVGRCWVSRKSTARLHDPISLHLLPAKAEINVLEALEYRFATMKRKLYRGLEVVSEVDMKYRLCVKNVDIGALA